jgi:hypothetical protein
LLASGNGGHDSSIDLRWHFEIAAIKLGQGTASLFKIISSKN